MPLSFLERRTQSVNIRDVAVPDIETTEKFLLNTLITKKDWGEIMKAVEQAGDEWYASIAADAILLSQATGYTHTFPVRPFVVVRDALKERLELSPDRIADVALELMVGMRQVYGDLVDTLDRDIHGLVYSTSMGVLQNSSKMISYPTSVASSLCRAFPLLRDKDNYISQKLFDDILFYTNSRPVNERISRLVELRILRPTLINVKEEEVEYMSQKLARLKLGGEWDEFAHDAAQLAILTADEVRLVEEGPLGMKLIFTPMNKNEVNSSSTPPIQRSF